jgi:hypothetical protein
MDHLPEVVIEFGEQRGKPVSILRFKYNNRLISLISKINGSVWSQTLRAWVIPVEERSTERIVKALSGSASIIFKNENVLVSDSKIDVALPSGYLELLQQKRYSPNTFQYEEY